jgi:outer membrane protein assembly factor BamD (BamD/ComL family)
MKKGVVTFIVLILVLLGFQGCEQKLGEQEYFDLAYQHMGKEQWSEAEKNFQKIINDYPNGTYGSKSLFMVGFLNANYMKNYGKAEKYYKEFLEKYPEHDLADDARYELENLGKDINDLPFLRGEESESDSVVAGKDYQKPAGS